MKNIFKILFPAIAMILSLASCDGDAEIPDRGPVTNPQEMTKGTYTGDWSRQEFGTENFTYSSGTVELTPGDANYVTNISVSCPDFEIDLSAAANITPGGQGYMFHNPIATNGFGAIFQGTIRESDMSLWLTFKKTVKEGRKTITYIYTFNGVRQ